MPVRALQPDDTPAVIALRREALSTTPLAFGASLEDDRGLSPELTRAALGNPAAAAIIGGFDGEALVGMVGITRLDKIKTRHRAMVWGMFVSPRARRTGLGAAMLRAAIDQARGWPGVLQVHLSVTDAAKDARRLYLAARFREWGVEPRALQWEGRFVAEHHLVLDLE